MTRAQQRIGASGEELAESVLRSLGIEQIERVGTPVKLIPSKAPGLFKVVFGEKVIGDRRGILPGGRSVLCEVKTILDRNLRYSDLREHQPAGLTRHTELGGLSLLIWVHSSGINVLEWPISGFGPGKSIDPRTAEIENWKGLQPHLSKSWLCECGYANIEDSPVCTHCWQEKP
jgi:hypothetical protein